MSRASKPADCAISRASASGASRTSGCGTRRSASPDAPGFVAGNASPGVEQQRRLLGADEARQGRGQVEPRMKAEPAKVGTEPGDRGKDRLAGA
jgi:hypothetical protein